MKRIVFHTMSLFILATGLTYCSGGQQIAKSKINDPGQLLFNGHVNADIKCYHCHNGDGAGTWRGDNLKDAKGLSKKKILTAINNGPGMFMPAYKDTLNEEQKQQLVDWITSLHGETPRE